jgi:hypothetical protein
LKLFQICNYIIELLFAVHYKCFYSSVLADLSGVMFVGNSDSKEWLQQGDYFLKNRLYGIAAKCYRKGGDEYKQALAKGHELAHMVG